MFLWDSGSSVGQIDGHGKDINSIDYKPTRPYRIVTGAEDMYATFYEGPPFKYKYQYRVSALFHNLGDYYNSKKNLFLFPDLILHFLY